MNWDFNHVISVNSYTNDNDIEFVQKRLIDMPIEYIIIFVDYLDRCRNYEITFLNFKLFSSTIERELMRIDSKFLDYRNMYQTIIPIHLFKTVSSFLIGDVSNIIMAYIYVKLEILLNNIILFYVIDCLIGTNYLTFLSVIR